MPDIDYSTLSKEDAEKLMHEKVSEAYAALAEAEALADTFKLWFNFEPAYGMGGTYEGGRKNPDTDDGWYPSSQSC
jgi:hypothetical protein